MIAAVTWLPKVPGLLLPCFPGWSKGHNGLNGQTVWSCSFSHRRQLPRIPRRLIHPVRHLFNRVRFVLRGENQKFRRAVPDSFVFSGIPSILCSQMVAVHQSHQIAPTLECRLDPLTIYRKQGRFPGGVQIFPIRELQLDDMLIRVVAGRPRCAFRESVANRRRILRVPFAASAGEL